VPQTNARANRYSEAAFGVARHENRLDDWVSALDRAAELFESRAAERYITSPVVSPDRKIAALRALLPDLPPTVRNFLELLARRDRLELLPAIREQFRRLYDELQGIRTAVLTTAVPLDTGRRELIAARLAQRFGARITIQTEVDPSILGGVIARVGDDVIDGSVRGRLERLRRALTA
jgi:F-type H+-transporting ATPase subunit delta